MSRFNSNSWPVVYFKIDVKEITNETFEDYKKQYLELLVRAKRENKKIILLSDLNHIKKNESFPMNFLMKQMKFNKDCYKFNKEYLQCVCILCNSSRLKSILNIYFTMIKQAAPYKICKDTNALDIYLKEKYNIEMNTSIFYVSNSLTDIITEEETEEIDQEKLKQEVKEQLEDMINEDENENESENEDKITYQHKEKNKSKEILNQII
jgi:hypothetical protein